VGPVRNSHPCGCEKTAGTSHLAPRAQCGGGRDRHGVSRSRLAYSGGDGGRDERGTLPARPVGRSTGPPAAAGLANAPLTAEMHGFVQRAVRREPSGKPVQATFG